MKKTVILIKSLSFVFVLGGLAPSFINAQDHSLRNTENSVQNLPRISRTSGMGNFHASFSGKNISSDFLINHFGEWLGTNNDHTFKFVTSSTDDLGFKRSSYQHYYKDVKVADELVLIHEKDNKITFVNGELSDEISFSIKQPLSQSEVENIVNADMKTPNVTFDEFDQVITKVYSGKGVELHLVSQISALSLKTLQGFMYYVDNTTKQVVKKLEKIHNHNIAPKINNVFPLNKVSSISKTFFISPLVDAPSTSATYYKGNQSITVDSYNGAYRLKDNARNIHTLDGTGWDGNGTASTGLTGNIAEYTSNTANYMGTNTKPAVEVHWAMEKAKDYYIDRHNRNSYDGNGSIIRNYYNINFNTPNTPIQGDNAAALDVQGIVAMIYGNGLVDGQSGIFNPFVALDIAGHEYSHLMVGRTANLAYQAESGALNESFADMFGTAIEFYSGISPNWNIGEGIPNHPLLGLFIRSMSDPNSGSFILGSQQPDTYGGTYWITPVPPYDNSNDKGGVHTNSGVGNHWFYLLSVGGSGTNDLGTAFNVTGITIQKAEKIAYRTLATYLTANSGYINAYTASKQAAIDLYGAGSNELQQVENAWCAVGLGNCATFLAVNEATKSDIQDIKIYPNPVTNGQFTIESGLKGNVTYEIYDFSGKLIKTSEKLEKGINKINISGVQAAAYILKININGKIVSKKIIVE
ncbi:M4 family metallopeptidase [Chryseobacterium mulctrae]|uniref:M4 family metallopeptidase n=1 Tax=Chryseobacterium mulctrae TaxID=2576777 RepID=UPI00111706B9|nr:M4 family metallopeptidase [Chryseobacterium mulctrae]